jgi:hypothetical protein
MNDEQAHENSAVLALLVAQRVGPRCRIPDHDQGRWRC